MTEMSDMRRALTREALRDLMREIARRAPPGRSFQIFILGGSTAVYAGWRMSTIDADLYAAQIDVFRDIQDIKERLELNVEFARPEDFVPSLADTGARHVLIAVQAAAADAEFTDAAHRAVALLAR